MFRLYYKPTEQWVQIYNVQNDKCGFPMFLVYIDNQWMYKSAKHFTNRDQFDDEQSVINYIKKRL